MYKSIGSFFEKYEENTHQLIKPYIKENERQYDIQQNFENSNTANPEIWGPPFWFSLHISALHYPENPSDIVKERIKNRILAIPYELPCSSCRPHASSFVENSRNKLDEIVKNRENLFKFYVDFHNSVNQRKNKPLWTYEQSLKYYQGKSK